MGDTKEKDPTGSVIFLPYEEKLDFSEEITVLGLAQRGGVRLETSCGGMGTCGACRVFVIKEVEPLNPLTEQELEMADQRNFRPNERLGCQVQCRDGLVVEVPVSADKKGI